MFATISVAFAARRGGDLDEAEEHLRWLLATARGRQTEESRPPYLPMVLAELGMLAARRGDPATALAHHREAFAACRDQGSARGMAWALAGMAEALALDGRPGVAARLLGAVETTRRGTVLPPSPSDRAELDRITAAVRDAEPDFDALFQQGAELTPEQARSLADEGRA